MRAMLDQLMGAERDVPLDERVNRKKLFTDEDVDKYFLCGFDVTMFKNTKSADEIARALRVPVQQASKQEHPCGVQSMELRANFKFSPIESEVNITTRKRRRKFWTGWCPIAIDGFELPRN